MPTNSVPEPVRRLLAERKAARLDSDWARADALRDEIAAMGWEVQDRGTRSTARPILTRAAATDDASRLDEPASVEASIQVAAEDHPDDLARLLAGLAEHPPSASWELVVVDNGAGFELDAVLGGLPIEPVVVRSDHRLGWADARTLGMRRSLGEITVLLDSSLEPTGDFASPLLTAFEDSTVGIAGPWGVTSPNGRQFEEAPPGEVDAVEAYCLAVRRQALRAVGGFDRRFQFYRNADLDFSFAVRAAGWRAVRTSSVPLERHEHRGWESMAEAERDRLSKRNFYRFLKHWGDRRDLLTNPAPRR
jgi:GT2 family glycosyltransferase